MLLKLLIILGFGYFISGCFFDKCKWYGTDCEDYQCIGHTNSGVYHVTPRGTNRGFDVYCDMTTDGGGWLVFQRRLDGSVDFYKNWSDYETGFGDVSHEYWLGLLPLRRILSQGHYELKIDLEDFDGDTKYASYGGFDISDFSTNYTLKVTSYSGTAGDAMHSHNGIMFATRDRDNDDNCSERFKGAWWYDSCHSANLNGRYLSGNHTTYADGINWLPWRGSYYSLKSTEMKIRKA